MQNLQCCGPTTDSGLTTAFGAVAYDQGCGDPQCANAVEGGQGTPDFATASLAVYLSGLGRQGMQVPTQSVVVNTVTTPAAHMPPLPYQGTALGMPPLSASSNALPALPLVRQMSLQMSPMQLGAPAPRVQPPAMPFPPSAAAPGPVQPILPAAMLPIAQVQMPLRPNALQMPPSTTSNSPTTTTPIHSRAHGAATSDATLDAS